MPTLADLSRTCLRGAHVVAVVSLLAAAARAGDPPVKTGEWNKRDIPEGWVVHETPHYQVQSEIGLETAKKLGTHQEAMLEIYADFMPTRRKLEHFVLKVFKTKKGYAEYSNLPQDTTAVAYYRKDTKELVGYDCGFVFGKLTAEVVSLRADSGEGALTGPERQRAVALLDAGSRAYTFDLVRVLAHEGWHQYFHFFTVSWVSMPSWLDEGIGDYFFMAPRDMKDGDLPGYEIGRLNDHRLRRIRRGVYEGSFTPFDTFMDFDQEAYYANGGLNYAQGWSMVHFLLQNADADRRELIPRLIKDFKDTKNFPKSTDKVFRGEKMAQLNEDWLIWLLAQPVEDPFLTLARELGDKIKPDELRGEPRFRELYKWYLDHPEYALGAPKPVEPAAPKPPGAPVLKPAGNVPKPPEKP